MTPVEELLPCPFCGGAAEMRSWDWPYERWQVRCSKCKAHARARMAKEAEAAAAWNTRLSASIPPPIEAVEEVLKEARHWVTSHPVSHREAGWERMALLAKIDELTGHRWTDGQLRRHAALRQPPPVQMSDEALERWADIKDDTDAIVACGERWKAVASAIGCTLRGFNDGRGASFFTPDGSVIEVGPKFRAAIEALSPRMDDVRNRALEEAAKVIEDYQHMLGDAATPHYALEDIKARIRALSNNTNQSNGR